MKNYLKLLFTGIGVTLIMVLVMLKITMNFQILLFLGSIFFFTAGIINSTGKNHFLFKSILITMIFLAFFILIVLKEIPELWYFVPIYFAATSLGLLFNSRRQKTVVSLLLLSMIMLFLAIKIIPASLENSLTQTRFDQLPQFDIHSMTGEITDSKSLEGKVVVLDFFGTWCKPCIQELEELDKIKEALKDNDNVVFYIINADLGGDTPDKFNAFIEKNNYKFRFAYDKDSQIYNLLKLQKLGLPALLIIDKNQNIRLQHIGYNTAETNFTESIIQKINSLK